MKWTAMLLLSLSIVLPAAAADRRHAAYPAAPPCAEAVIAYPFLTLDLASDGEFVYFADDIGGLFRVARNGGFEARRVTAVTDGSFVISIVVDEQRVYFSTANADDFLSSIYSAPKSGGVPTLLASGVVTPFDLAADSDFLYWNSLGTLSGEDFLSDGKIERMRKDGSGRSTLASGLSYPLAIALDGDNVLFGETGLAIGNAAAGLRSVLKTGGVPTILFDGPPVLGIAATTTNYYVGYVETEALAGTVAAIAKDTKTLTKLASDSGLPLFPRVVGNELYYFLLSDTDSIRAVPLNGGSARIVKAGDFATQEFVVDSCAVFYGAIDFDFFQGSIRRSPR